MELPDGRFVPDAARIFLLPEEVLAAIGEDFDQYGPQPRLLLNLSPLILGPGRVADDPKRGGAWISIGSRGKMQLIDYGQLGTRLLDAMAADPPPLSLLAVVCRMVFQGRARVDRVRGQDGIWIYTAMETFSCVRCGHCCSQVGYPKEAAAEDVLLWRAAGREDILSWVGMPTGSREDRAHRIWIEPHTRRPAAVCPWLIQVRGSHLYRCAIHEEKPEICRLYPGSRKHALMTGCRGFENSMPLRLARDARSAP